MKKSMLSLLTGAALLGSVGVASAAEPMVLANAAMDTITAGVNQRAIAVAVNRCNRSVCQANAAAVNQNGRFNYAIITQLNIATNIVIR